MQIPALGCQSQDDRSLVEEENSFCSSFSSLFPCTPDILAYPCKLPLVNTHKGQKWRSIPCDTAKTQRPASDTPCSKNHKSVQCNDESRAFSRPDLFNTVSQRPSRTAATLKGTVKWVLRRSKFSLTVLNDPLYLSFPVSLVLKMR